MRLHTFSRTTLCLALMSLPGCFPLSCWPGQPMGQFGVYHRNNKTLRLRSGEQFTVYRVKTWTFTDGSPPALQLEYEPPVSVSDTVAVRHFARTVWPVFSRYVDGAGFHSAFITATNLRWKTMGLAWTAQQRSFGLIADRDGGAHWHLEGDTLTLPLADSSSSAGIFEYDGKPLLPSEILPPEQ